MNARRHDNRKETSTRREVLESVNACDSTHAGLWLERFSRNLEVDGNNAETIEGVVDHVQVTPEYKSHFNRWRKYIEEDPAMFCKEATAQGRMVVGLGAESILETSITLHRTYGVPFIPGSALKGLARSAARRLFVGEEWKEGGVCHTIMFGTTDKAGFVAFHDALFIPEKSDDKIPLDLDVMTVHHAKYYGGGNEPPADWDSPNPVSFVTARGRYLIALEGPQEWVIAAFDILEEALREDGIGAKTAAGYGRMRLEGHKTRKERAAEEAIQKKRIEEEQQARKVKIDSLKKGLNLGNANIRVPDILAYSTEIERATLAKSIIKVLNLNPQKIKQPQPWVQDLFKAAGEPLP